MLKLNMFKPEIAQRGINTQTSWQRKMLESSDNILLSKGKVRTLKNVNQKADELILSSGQNIKEKITKVKEIICQKIKTKQH